MKKLTRIIYGIGFLAILAGICYMVAGPIIQSDWASGTSERYRIHEIAADAHMYNRVEILSAHGRAMLRRPTDNNDIDKLANALKSIRFSRIPAPASKLKGTTIIWFRDKAGEGGPRIHLALDIGNGSYVARYLRSEQLPKTVTSLMAKRHRHSSPPI